MGSDESHFNVSVGSDGQSHKAVAEAVSNQGPSAYQPNALPLGQTGSLGYATEWALFISAQLSTDAVSALRNVSVLITLRASLSGTFPPNSARFSYATEGALFISAQLSADAVSALRKVWYTNQTPSTGLRHVS